MKKMILLLVLPLTSLMAIDFIMTQEGLFTDTTTTSATTPQPPTSGTAHEASNPYLEAVNLPKCDVNNPEVQFIRNTADWSTINSSSKRIFCVSPGDYTSLKNITLTASGTVAKRRYIVLDNGNDTHPGKLNTSELAQYALLFNGASYWTVDRGALVNKTITYQYELKNGSRNNIFNRCFSDEVYMNVYMREDSDNTTIQQCRFQNMRHAGRKWDFVSVLIKDWATEWSCKNVKVINNEFKNMGDAFQSYVADPDPNGDGSDYEIVSVEGLIIDSNDMYITSDIYTDGNGNYTPTGIRAYAENAIDLKAGSRNLNNPVIVTNNRTWGYRRADSTDSSLSDWGWAIVAHMGCGGFVMKNNLVFDSNGGIVTADPRFEPYAVYDSEISDNILVDNSGLTDTTAYQLSFIDSNTITANNNTVFDARSKYMKAAANGDGMVVTNNIGLNATAGALLSNTGGTYTGNITYPTAAGAGYTEDYVFTTDIYTNSPRVITLPNILKP